MLRTLHITVRVLAWGLIGLGLMLVVAMVRLDAGPLRLDWLQPRIEQALTPESGKVAVTTGGIELRLNKKGRTLELVGVDVRYRIDADAETPAASFLAFPEVQLALSVEALLKRGMIAASEFRAKAPSLIITRNEDGVIGLRSEASDDDRFDNADFGAFLYRFAQAQDGDDRLAFLRKLQIGGGRVAFYDRTRASALTAEDADLVLIRRDGGVDGWLRADVLQKSVGPAAVQLSGRIESGSDRIAFEADVADLMPADLPALWPLESSPIPADVAGMRLLVRASIAGELDLDGGVSPLEFDIRAAAGVVDLPTYLAEPLDVSVAELRGTLASDYGAFEIDHAALVSRGAEIDASGGIAWREGARELALDLAVSDVRAQNLRVFWPPSFGAKTRKWVLGNIRRGRVSTGEVRLDLKPSDWGLTPLRDDALAGKFAFEGLSVRYVDEMPPLEEASGVASFDADRMDFDVEAGRNAGLTLKGGSVTITGMGKPGRRLTTQLQVLANAEGPIEQALALLDHPPLKVAEEIAIAPEDTAGSVSASIDVKMPLHDDVTVEEVVVLAEAELTDLAVGRLPKLKGDVRLDQGTFRLTVEEDAVRLEGSAAVNEIPLAINVYEPRADGAAKRRIGLQGRLSRQQLESQGLAPDGLDGDFGFKATVTETGSHLWIDFEADLAALALAPPGLAWRKPAGQAGVLYASIAAPIEQGTVEIKQFDIETGDLRASGALSLSSADGGLERLAFDGFRLGDTDAAIRISPDDKGGFEVVIEGARLDLDALFGDDPDFSDRLQRFHAVLRADQLKARGVELVNVEADAAHAADGWRSASLIGALSSGGKVALELTPDGDDQSLELRSENAGALIEALDLGQRIDGGSLLLSARIQSQGPKAAKGRLEIEDFILQDAPLLARILTLASLTGIDNLLGGEGVKVDHLIMPFALDDRKLTFTDGLMRGSQLGLTFKGDVDLEEKAIDVAGTIIPVYSLNRLIGQVPIIGRILAGVDGRGAFAATYSIKGPRSGPTVYVNPLSILTPGLIRDLIGGLINGTLEPPEVRETDD